MTRVTWLSLITLLAGVLATIGCGDDTNGGGSGGSAGAAGTGGSGGSAATGGAGGAGGAGGTEECIQTCGVDNEFPLGATVATGLFECDVMGIPIPITFEFAAAADGDVVPGDNEITLNVRTIIPPDVVNLILNIATSATIISTEGTVISDAEPVMIVNGLSPVPCLICYEPDTEVIVNVNPVMQTYNVAGPIEVDFILEFITITLDTGGLELTLTNGGANAPCEWMGVQGPTITLPVVEP